MSLLHLKICSSCWFCSDGRVPHRSLDALTVHTRCWLRTKHQRTAKDIYRLRQESHHLFACHQCVSSARGGIDITVLAVPLSRFTHEIRPAALSELRVMLACCAVRDPQLSICRDGKWEASRKFQTREAGIKRDVHVCMCVLSSRLFWTASLYLSVTRWAHQLGSHVYHMLIGTPPHKFIICWYSYLQLLVCI